MLFTGLSEHSIDAKLRLAIPAKYRNLWSPERDGSAWYCVPWPTGLLRLYTEGAFEKLAEQGDATLTPGREESELEAQLFGSAERLEMDSAGRIMIPKMHMELAGLGSEVVVIGARTRLEVRDRKAWQAGVSERFASLPELARAIEEKKRQGTR